MPRRITAPHGPDALDQLRELVDGRPKAKIAESIGMSRTESFGRAAERFFRAIRRSRPSRESSPALRPPRTLWADLNPPPGA